MQSGLRGAASLLGSRTVYQSVPTLSGASNINGNLPPTPSVHKDGSYKVPLSYLTMSEITPSREGATRSFSGLGVTSGVRRLHTGNGLKNTMHNDITVPDFDGYRRDDVKDPTAQSSQSSDKRHAFTYSVYGALGAAAMSTEFLDVVSLVQSLAPGRDVLAMSKTEIDINNIPEGKSMVFKWQGKPVFVRHRTAEEIQTEQAVDVKGLRHPETDQERVKLDKWLVVLGICTHLGCVPIANAGAFGGYYCPCHGSHYDSSGRIRIGPAPLNLEVPEYEFQGNTLVIG